MLISIIVPAYNSAETLYRSLKTWTEQSISSADYEIIVVDNNSTDLTADIINDYSNRYEFIKYLKEERPGATNARHAGAKVARANILVFCDDDGVFNFGFVQSILEVYKANSKVVAVTGKIDIEWDKQQPGWIEPYLFMLGKLDYGDKVLYRKDLFLNGGIFSIKKETFKNLGGFNPDLIDGHLIGDGDTGLVHKLHEANCLIGYTPFAVMKHLQFVNTHGTFTGLGRRFYNVGISNSYRKLRLNNFSINLNMYKYIMRSLFFISKKYIEYKITKRMNSKIYFSLQERKGELAFFIKLFNPDIRKEIFRINLFV